MFSSSYETTGMAELITMLVKQVNPQRVLEIGTQQGGSAQIIANAMSPDTYLCTCDLFRSKYPSPPYGYTHSSLEKAKENLSSDFCPSEMRIEIVQAGYPDLLKSLDKYYIDLLHIDICNHYDNLKPILYDIVANGALFVNKMILLEGGIYNRWQKECGFKSFAPMLEEDWLCGGLTTWNYDTIPFNNHNALTVLRRTNVY